MPSEPCQELGIATRTVVRWLKTNSEDGFKGSALSDEDEAVEDRKTAWEVLEQLLESALCHIHTILTKVANACATGSRDIGNGIQFDMICEANEVELRPTHPWRFEGW